MNTHQSIERRICITCEKQRYADGTTPNSQRGFALITTVIIVLIAGILLSGTVGLTRETERTAGNAIQYSRAMEAAEGGAVVAQNRLIEMSDTRLFSDSTGSEGIFSHEAIAEQWWHDPDFTGQHSVDAGTMLGVVAQPNYIYEEIGEYASDRGTGIVSLDIGGAAYGRTSAGAREHVLYKVEAQGVGSMNEVTRAVETVVVIAK